MVQFTHLPILFHQGKLTYGKIGEWRFDKRSYSNGAPPKNLPLPPPGVPETVVSSTPSILSKLISEGAGEGYYGASE